MRVPTTYSSMGMSPAWLATWSAQLSDLMVQGELVWPDANTVRLFRASGLWARLLPMGVPLVIATHASARRVIAVLWASIRWSMPFCNAPRTPGNATTGINVVAMVDACRSTFLFSTRCTWFALPLCLAPMLRRLQKIARRSGPPPR